MRLKIMLILVCLSGSLWGQKKLLLRLEPGQELPQWGQKKVCLAADWGIWSYSIAEEDSAVVQQYLVQHFGPENWQWAHQLRYRARPNDPEYDFWQWNMELLGLPEIWEETSGGLAGQDSIVVAVIDGGGDWQHEDLAENIYVNWGEVPDDGIDNDQNGYIDDFRGWRADTEDDEHAPDSHASSVAGIIGARGDNGIGMAGINWRVKVMLLSAQSANSLLEEGNLLATYYYIWKMRQLYKESGGQRGAYILVSNLSAGVDFGRPEDHPLWCGVYDSLGQAGILSVAASMNRKENIDEVGDMPCLCPSEALMTVSLSNRYDALDQNAPYGPLHLDLAAPGAVYTLRPNDTYNVFGGTSGAAPHLAGGIALLASYPAADWQAYLKAEPQAAMYLLRDIILATVSKKEDMEELKSGGRLDLGAAFRLLKSLYGPKLEENSFLWRRDSDQLYLSYRAQRAGKYRLVVRDLLGRQVFLGEKQLLGEELTIWELGFFESRQLLLISLYEENSLIKTEKFVY
ncbi:S8 family serine peptidase [Saprospira sp. CCB-QB6]|uniref:S8 family serine peptidase n=1 Tax=Saprospira sp. CCB-QB6 TaxID=3023936 RepID=UPI002349FC8D|nr:S8 family serine peptidase [Saprospira sp. CCB-QB6]WCL80144.1 S8 family serine peptidase [Saprospira sp. CCB-QB6]